MNSGNQSPLKAQTLSISSSIKKCGSWATRHNRALTIAAACVTPILYLLYVNHYAVNVLQGDDWNTVFLLNGALKGHLSLSQLWGQYAETRIFMTRVVLVAFAFIDRFDTRSVILFDAAMYIAAYGLMLVLFGKYLGKRLTPVPVLVLGLVWFSLADVQAALWAFQVGWYLVVLGLMVTLFALLVPKTHRGLWFTAAGLAAGMASLAFIQGFIVWPLGVICILWRQPWTRRAFTEATIWVGAAAITGIVYLSGFNPRLTGCSRWLGCTPGAAYASPLLALHFFVILLGNVIPGGYLGSPVKSLIRFEVVGSALLAAVVFILIQSWRHRGSGERTPLPLLMICFALLFDAMIVLGRTGEGLTAAVNGNRYVLPNIVLLTGVVMYAWKYAPRFRLPTVNGPWKTYVTWLPLAALILFLTVQVVVATEFGLNSGRLDRLGLINEARLAVNLDRVPANERACERVVMLTPSPDFLKIAAGDGLGEFSPNTYRYYRKLGPPTVPKRCERSDTNR